ncbi:class I SAM-dependent methyltransferase [Salinicoccus hispanicus]|uniref:Methyltransferase domain-containing protein n=1 Tax=Salinicoccus hispanicus TaxID=157225 RepID=A0A6N8TYN5_9STAP|nr:class I SAM-dependent methyltransferase [Salinicoccus hispanicus]MXQ50137.1 methyltransferase domain-containing protein [Salinicoccus hispanicus]
MLSNEGFDLWANGYDRTVQISEDNNTYPFAGYRKILNMIFGEVMKKDRAEVLDIGIGTGVLASRLYDNDHKIDGIDFSEEMLSIAQPKMKDANLIEWNIAEGLPAGISNKKYDSIVSTYTLHHFTDEEKLSLLKTLLSRLKDDGKILIGDISFENKQDHDACRLDNADNWDDDEFYFINDDIEPELSSISNYGYHQVSHCGGLYIIKNL